MHAVNTTETILSPGKRRAIVHTEDFAEAVLSACRRFKSQRVFMVVSHSLCTNHPDKVYALAGRLRAGGHHVVSIYDKVLPHTPGRCLAEALEIMANDPPDLFVSIGGGAVVDAVRALRCSQIFGARTVAEMAAVADRTVPWSRHLTDYAIDDLNLPPFPSRFVCVMTTPSGSDFSMGGGFLDETTGIKKQFFHPGGYADVVILDKQLMLLTPQKTWLEVGLRPVLPGVSALISNYATHYIRRRAEAGLQDLIDGLEACRREPMGADARELVAVGTWQCVDAVIMAKGGGLPYALSHAIGSITGMGHSATTGITLVAWVSWCEQNLPDRRTIESFRILRRAFGAEHGSAHAAIREFFRNAGMPLTLAEAGVDHLFTASVRRQVATSVFNMPIVKMGIEPRPLHSALDVEEVLALAING